MASKEKTDALLAEGRLIKLKWDNGLGRRWAIDDDKDAWTGEVVRYSRHLEANPDRFLRHAQQIHRGFDQRFS